MPIPKRFTSVICGPFGDRAINIWAAAVKYANCVAKAITSLYKINNPFVAVLAFKLRIFPIKNKAITGIEFTSSFNSVSKILCLCYRAIIAWASKMINKASKANMTGFTKTSSKCLIFKSCSL